MDRGIGALMGAALLCMGAAARTEVISDQSVGAVSQEPLASNPALLAQCVTACKTGGATFRAFCNSLPDPKLRAGCWALQFASFAACSGWCYWHFSE
jgi:hypothetical protein